MRIVNGVPQDLDVELAIDAEARRQFDRLDPACLIERVDVVRRHLRQDLSRALGSGAAHEGLVGVDPFF